MREKASFNTVGKLALTIGGGLLSLEAFRPLHAEPKPCASSSSAHVSVDLKAHRLYLCTLGKPYGSSFDIRIGHNGIGKQKEGDGKTPIGTYVLGKVRPSKRYGLFISIGYPTVEQKQWGSTGGAVGIHGPDRRIAWVGRAVNWFDTTDGCVGLASDEDMKTIGAWIGKTKAHRIRLF